MADLASSAVTILKSWTEGGTNGRQYSCRRVKLVLTGQGTTTNAIPASVLLLTTILECSNFITSDDGFIYLASPSVDGSELYLADMSVATDAVRDVPVDVTATLYGVVKGQAA